MKKLLNWGVIGAGRVCHDYVTCIKSVPGNNLTAVANEFG